MRTLPRDSAARITALYVIVAGLWIVLSDRALAAMTQDSALLVNLGIYKGWGFVSVTAMLLYFERKLGDRRQRECAAIVASSDDAIVGETLDGTIKTWNQGAERLYGYLADEVIGQPVSLVVPPQRRQELSRMLESITRGVRIDHQETERISKDGERVYVSVSMSPILDSAGRVTGVSAIARDLTDRRRAEEAARMAEVGKLASGLAHEVRNPLNAMRMQIAVISSRLEKPNEQNLAVAMRQLTHLESEVLRLQDVVNAFLAYGRPPADKLVEFDLHSLVQEVIEFLKPELKEHGIEAQLHAGSETGASSVIMDQDKLRQVLLNLTENAVAAMPEGGTMSITLQTDLEALEATLAVRDTGCGIPSDNLPRVFDAFYSTKPDGNGMGLAIVKRIVEGAGGTISVESSEGKGTSFTIHLPTASPARRRALQLQADREMGEVTA